MRWALRSAVLAFSIGTLFFLPFKPWNIGLFLVLSVWIYLSSLEERKIFKKSFFLLVLATILIALGLGTAPIFAKAIVIVILSLIFFLLVGLSNFLFSSPPLIYQIIITSLSILIGAIFFYILADINRLWLGLAGISTSFFLVFYEILNFEGIADKKRIVTSAVCALLLGEIASLGIFLPLNFLGFAAFEALIFMVLKNLIISHLKGTMSLKFILGQVIIFTTVAIIIFSSSRWVI